MTQTTYFQNLRAQAQNELAPLVDKIDNQGYYPEDYLHRLGQIGGFNLNLNDQLQTLREVGKIDGATAFSAWCQATCAWYLLHSPNAKAREAFLAQVRSGELLAGTGMSNTMKHLSGIEKNNLKAQRVEGGYLVSGGLPWVSNLGSDHLLISTAQVSDTDYVMFAVRCDTQGVKLQNCPEFCALEGTATLNVSMNQVFIPDEHVLAQPTQFKPFIYRIKPGFLLLQIGMGLGIVDGCLNIIQKANNIANAFLEPLDDLLEEAQALIQDVEHMAQTAQEGDQAILPVLQARAKASELALALSQAAALHTGARGYFKNSPAFRRQREAMFVAIVTPSLRHLRREIALLQDQEAQNDTLETQAA